MTLARCVCGQPVAFTIRRRHTFGVGPFEHVCPDCAPAPVECAYWEPFDITARDDKRLMAQLAEVTS